MKKGPEIVESLITLPAGVIDVKTPYPLEDARTRAFNWTKFAGDIQRLVATVPTKPTAVDRAMEKYHITMAIEKTNLLKSALTHLKIKQRLLEK